jgi:hypothetical protein
MKLKILAVAVFSLLSSVASFAENEERNFTVPVLHHLNDALPKVYLLPYELEKNDLPAKKGPARIEVVNQNAYARKEEDELPQYFGLFGGAASVAGLIVLDVLFSSIGVSAYYINHNYNFLWLTIGYLCSHSTFVRKRAIAEHIRALDEIADSSAPSNLSV